MDASTAVLGILLAAGPAGLVARGGKAVDPSELGPRAREAVLAWQPFARERGYRFEIDPDERVVLVVGARKKSTRHQRRLVAAVLEEIDDLLPPPPEPVAAGVGPEAATILPDGSEHAWVLFELSTASDQRALFDRFVELEPWLEDWARNAAAGGGFALERPLAAGWVLDAAEGREEWNPDNELAHRLAHLALLDRYGQIPFWLQTGLCWQIEQESTGEIFSFPYRSGFVARIDHGGWGPQLRAEYRRKKSAPARMQDLAAWQRGRFVEADAARAWGTARFLVREHASALPAILTDLARARAEGAIVREGPRWHVEPDYVVPVSEQEALFQRHLGPDFLAQVAAWFRRGAR